MTIVTALLGHTSQETAFIIADYPFGFKLRCRMRCWLETHPKKGVRFMTQTTNPKAAGGVWNKPKASTYACVAGGMYLDENGHVQWTNVNEYTNAEKALEFAKAFGDSSDRALLTWAKMKAKFSEGLLSGRVVHTINGVHKPLTETEKAEHEKDARAWGEVVAVLTSKTDGQTLTSEVSA